MIVYICSTAIPYEGEYYLGTFATKELAEKAFFPGDLAVVRKVEIGKDGVGKLLEEREYRTQREVKKKFKKKPKL